MPDADELLYLDDLPALSIKLQLERAAPRARFLLYTNKQRFEFIQTEPVAERVLARSVPVGLRDGETMISDEQSVTFDSSSGLMDERKRSAILTIRSGQYDKSKDYFLIARDTQTRVEVMRIALKVDLAFAHDFQAMPISGSRRC